MKIKTIIFSKDRPAQLHLLLHSLIKYDTDVEELFAPMVLYTASNDKFMAGYEKVQKSLSAMYTEWYLEKDFRTDLLQLLDKADDCVMFLVDDMIMMRELGFNWTEAVNFVSQFNVACLTLRLGLNTTWQYQTDQPTIMPSLSFPRGPFFVWNRHTVPLFQNFNYPLSTDGHIFKTDLITLLIRQTHFTTPNSLEANLQDYVRTMPSLMGCLENSIFVNNVINRVQDAYPNKTGVEISITPEELNKNYLEGQQLDLDRMNFDKVKGCHQELEVYWK